MMKTHRKLLVEGKDDRYVICSLLENYQVPEEAFVIKVMEGIDKILGNLDVELKESDLKTIGVVVDADENITSRWQALQQRLQKSGYKEVPANPQSEGSIIHQDELPDFGIWLMPDNRLSGMLEDFVGFLVPENERPLYERAGRAVDEIPPEERKFPPQRRSKAHVHTWLAWQEEPGKPMGQAITLRYLDPNCKEAKGFIAWLKNLFEIV